MAEPAQFAHPETEVSETRFVRGLSAIAIVGGAVIAIGTGARELLVGDIDNSQATSLYLTALALEASGIPAHIIARRRGQAAQQQIEAASEVS